MRRQFILWAILVLSALQQLKAQNCIDTVHVKGYYIIKRRVNEIKPVIRRHGNNVIQEQAIDLNYEPSFIPSDSISEKRNFSYWFNHFLDDTQQVFISCEKCSIKHLLQQQCLPDSISNNRCSFPVLKSNRLYYTTNINTGDVFEVYYLDAYWAKIKILKNSPQADIVPGKIAQRCISLDAATFDLYYFIKADKVEQCPAIKDRHLNMGEDDDRISFSKKY